jgi:O-antigen/teichoic acid export membrane protein
VRAYTRLAVRPCVAGLALVALADPIVPTHLRPSWTIVAMVAGFTVVNVFVLAMRAIAIAINQVMVYFRYTALGQVILLAAMGGLYVGGVTSVSAWFLTYVLSGIVPTAICWIGWWRTRDRSDAPVDAGQSRAVRREGLALIPASIANMGMLRVDRLILPALASTTELGLYATVATMTQPISWPLQAYADARLGAWRAAHRGGWLRSSPLVLSAAIYCLAVAPVLGVITYLLVVPLFGDPYAAAKVLVPPLIAAAAVYALSRITLGLLIAQRRNLLASTAEVCGFAVSMLGYVLLIPSQGAMGAAYGSLLGYGACLIVAAVAVRLGRTGAGRPEPPG